MFIKNLQHSLQYIRYIALLPLRGMLAHAADGSEFVASVVCFALVATSAETLTAVKLACTTLGIYCVEKPLILTTASEGMSQ